MTNRITPQQSPGKTIEGIHESNDGGDAIILFTDGTYLYVVARHYTYTDALEVEFDSIYDPEVSCFPTLPKSFTV